LDFKRYGRKRRKVGPKMIIVSRLNGMVFTTLSRYNFIKQYGVLDSKPLNTMERCTP